MASAAINFNLIGTGNCITTTYEVTKMSTSEADDVA